MDVQISGIELVILLQPVSFCTCDNHFPHRDSKSGKISLSGTQTAKRKRILGNWREYRENKRNWGPQLFMPCHVWWPGNLPMWRDVKVLCTVLLCGHLPARDNAKCMSRRKPNFLICVDYSLICRFHLNCGLRKKRVFFNQFNIFHLMLMHQILMSLQHGKGK